MTENVKTSFIMRLHHKSQLWLTFGFEVKICAEEANKNLTASFSLSNTFFHNFSLM